MKRKLTRGSWSVALFGAAVLAGCGPVSEPADWSTDATVHREELDQQFAYLCPPGGTPGTIWGTDTYTDDSSICTAAVHAGQLDLATGGTVTIKMVAGLQSYAGTTRNGITSEEYGAWENAFVFVE